MVVTRRSLMVLGLVCVLAFVWGPVLRLPAPADLVIVQRCETAP